MNGFSLSTDRRLSERDLLDLANALALQIHATLGPRVYLLAPGDVAQLTAPFVDDLTAEDRQDVAWIVWHLFQDAYELELNGR